MAVRKSSKTHRSKVWIMAVLVLITFVVFVVVVASIQANEKLGAERKARETSMQMESTGHVAGASDTHAVAGTTDNSAKDMEQGINNYLITIVAMVALGIVGAVGWSRLQSNS